MKRLLSILLTLFICTTASSQITHSIVIDRNTFRAVQTDALTGVNIDPIRVDRSRRPCARVKIFFHKMTREQMAELEPVFPSGIIDYTTCRVAEGNTVLILEFTAKPNVSFYLKHPSFGTSNEVTLSVEGDKEYQLEATLNQTYSIVVESNVVGAEIYIDGVFRGQTDDNRKCIISDVMIGEHKLKVVYGSALGEKLIDVNKNAISFTQNVDIAAATPQHVVFEVTPVDIDAMVEIDGAFLPVTRGSEGIVDKLLKQGKYHFTVTAPNYNTYTGEVTVYNKKVELQVALTPAFGFLNISGDSISDAVIYVDNKRVDNNAANHIQLPSGNHLVKVVKPRYKPYQTEVEISDGQTVNVSPSFEQNFALVTVKASTEDVDIWLNGSYVSSGVHTAELEFGTYEVEGRKKSHSSSPQFFDVTTAEPMTVVLNAPTPIYGSVDVSSTPQKGEIYIDDVATGQQTPATINNVLVGEHTITVKKSGYYTNSQRVTIVKDDMQYVTVPLRSNSQSTVTKTPVVKPATPTKSKPAPNRVRAHYQQSVDVGYSMHFVPNTIVNHVGVSYIGGVRANRTMFVGIGVGAEYNFDNIDNSKLPALSAGGFNVPIYIHARAYMGARSRTFFSLSAGGKLFGSDNFTHNGVEYKYHTNGAFADLGFGVNIGKFYFSLGATAQMLPWEESYTEKQLDIKSNLCFGAKVSLGFTF